MIVGTATWDSPAGISGIQIQGLSRSTRLLANRNNIDSSRMSPDRLPWRQACRAKGSSTPSISSVEKTPTPTHQPQ